MPDDNFTKSRNFIEHSVGENQKHRNEKISTNWVRSINPSAFTRQSFLFIYLFFLFFLKVSQLTVHK
jgi:hypothetical protein